MNGNTASLTLTCTGTISAVKPCWASERPTMQRAAILARGTPRIAARLGDGRRLAGRPRAAVRRPPGPEAGQHLPEALAVLGAVDRIGQRAADRRAGAPARHREAERRLPAELHGHALRP